MTWNEFEESSQNPFSLIPKGTIAKVIMTIVPGGHNDLSKNWTGGYATRNPEKGSVYLVVKFEILEGKYAHRQIWGKIGLHSEKGPKWAKIGSDFIKSIVSSARRVRLSDESAEAKNARKINSFAELDAMEFVVRIDVETRDGKERNIIKQAITLEHKDYEALMNQKPQAAAPRMYAPEADTDSGSEW